MTNKYPDPTPRMILGAAAAVFLITLTMLFPKWLIVPVIVAVLFISLYGISVVMQAVIDNEWPWE